MECRPAIPERVLPGVPFAGLDCAPIPEEPGIPAPPRPLPSPDALERTVQALERKGNLRVLICAVQAWDDVDEPTRRAKLAQVRAFLALGSTDRAWARLHPLLLRPSSAEEYQLGGRILLDQGRLPDAVELLRRGQERFPEHEGIRRQLHRSEAPQTLVDRTDPVDSNADGLVRLAEHHLSTGALLRAKGLLERVLQMTPDHPRATDLLWVMEGDFRLRGLRLHDLTRVYGGSHEPQQLEPISPTDFAAERTESALPEHMALVDPPSGRFPNLFKNLEPQTELHPFQETHEPTQFAEDRFQSSDNLHLPQWAHEEQLDTQIQRVVRTSDGPEGKDTDIDKTEPGVAAGLDGESEDEDVVVRRPAEASFLGDRTETYRPLTVDPSRERLPEGADTADEGADFLRPRPVPAMVEETPTDVPTEADTAPPTAAPEPPPSAPSRSPESSRPPPSPEPSASAAPPKEVPPVPRDLDPASLPPPLDDDYDLSELYPQPMMSWTAWLLLGMLIGGTAFAILVLVGLASLL